jgi:hypothetical protein
LSFATPFPRRHFPLQFVGEALEEDHVVLGLLPFRRFRRHQRGDALAVRSEIVDADSPELCELFVGPYARLIRDKSIRFRGVRGHHDPVAVASEESAYWLPPRASFSMSPGFQLLLIAACVGP